MQKQPSALLVYGRPGPLDTLSEAVNERLFQTTRVRTCAEARRKFQTANSPHVAAIPDCLTDSGPMCYAWWRTLLGDQGNLRAWGFGIHTQTRLARASMKSLED
jgi:hypothetical protein